MSDDRSGIYIGAEIERPESAKIYNLTGREKEVLSLVARGHSYKQCARELSVSTLTVGAHLKNIYTKLKVHSRTAAVFEATRHGILKIEK
jgi:DNA-binding CsgD family transcriptional regulator